MHSESAEVGTAKINPLVVTAGMNRRTMMLS